MTVGGAGNRPVSFAVCTDDGVRLAGVRFGAPSSIAFVIGHGFCGSWHSVFPLAIKLAQRGTVYALDFRGHGGSGGRSTLGNFEAFDVRAVVALARRECGPAARVVTIGASMGGIAVLREAAYFASSDAVVSISAPAQWKGQQARARLLGMLVTSSVGRSLASRFLRTRIEPEWMWPPAPVDLVPLITKPLLFVHGAADRFVRPAQAKLLNAAAGKLGCLRVIERYGHAESGFDERIVALIDREIALHAA